MFILAAFISTLCAPLYGLIQFLCSGHFEDSQEQHASNKKPKHLRQIGRLLESDSLAGSVTCISPTSLGSSPAYLVHKTVLCAGPGPV